MTAALRTAVTPDAVRAVALELFAQKGYHGTALSEVAGRLEIRTSSLYNHINSKQELLAQILLTTSRDVLDDFDRAVEDVDSVTDRLAAAVRVYALRHATHRHEALVVNADVAALDEPTRSDVLDLRRRHEGAIRNLTSYGAFLELDRFVGDQTQGVARNQMHDRLEPHGRRIGGPHKAGIGAGEGVHRSSSLRHMSGSCLP